MPSEYEVVVDLSSMLSSLLPILIHTFIVVAQCFVAGFFLVHGLVLLSTTDGPSPFFRRFGAVRPGDWS